MNWKTKLTPSKIMYAAAALSGFFLMATAPTVSGYELEEKRETVQSAEQTIETYLQTIETLADKIGAMREDIEAIGNTLEENQTRINEVQVKNQELDQLRRRTLAAEERVEEQRETQRQEQETATRAQRLGLVQATVTRIVDGDTIEVRFADGTEETIRFIGIDTPERGQAGFNEATAFTRSEIEAVGNVVWLQASGNNRCSFGRLRRYVWLAVPENLQCCAAELNLGTKLVNAGHATIWTPPAPVTPAVTETPTATQPAGSGGTYWWTVRGGRYHTSRNCRGLRNANERNIRSGTHEQARQGGRTRCAHS